MYIKEPNAFATGRKTVCITEGLLHMPEDQIKATLEHEFGHLSHKDTDLILIVSVGNMIVSAFTLGIKTLLDLFHLIYCVLFLASFQVQRAYIFTYSGKEGNA